MEILGRIILPGFDDQTYNSAVGNPSQGEPPLPSPPGRFSWGVAQGIPLLLFNALLGME